MPHRRMTANDLTCRSHYGPVNVRNRRVSPVPVHPGESPLTEPTPAVRRCPRERVFMPLDRPSWREGTTARLGGFETFADAFIAR